MDHSSDNRRTTNQATNNSFSFKKSSFCESAGCVEVALLPDGTTLVRDSKDNTLPSLKFTKEEWIAFVKGVQHSEFGQADAN